MQNILKLTRLNVSLIKLHGIKVMCIYVLYHMFSVPREFSPLHFLAFLCHIIAVIVHVVHISKSKLCKSFLIFWVSVQLIILSANPLNWAHVNSKNLICPFRGGNSQTHCQTVSGWFPSLPSVDIASHRGLRADTVLVYRLTIREDKFISCFLKQWTEKKLYFFQ